MRTKLFLCYSRDDAKFRNELKTQLMPCSDALELWSDQLIPPGVQWLPEIDRALTTADAAVIVVSPTLLESEFVSGYELPRILKRHGADGMRALWIHYRPALYKRTPLADFQCLHDPEAPLTTLRKPVRDRVLVEIANKVCEKQPMRLVANAMRAADEVFVAEHGMPSLTAQVHPDRIDMKVTGGGAMPFVTKADLDRRMGGPERKVLRTHERTMEALLRRWSRLHPQIAAAGPSADPRMARELADVRTALAKEFDAALGFIESLGYSLDDHYQAVRHVVGSEDLRTPARRALRPAPSIRARFVLDRKGRPQWSDDKNGYWLQASIDDAPEKTGSAVWRMHRSIRPARETIDARPEFRKDFVAHGDFTLRADLRTKTRTVAQSVERTLIDALEAEYPGRRAKPLQKALDDIATH
jgi:hypothetical protein